MSDSSSFSKYAFTKSKLEVSSSNSFSVAYFMSILHSLNFTLQLVGVLREVKYLQMLNQSDIPDTAAAFFEKRETLTKVCLF